MNDFDLSLHARKFDSKTGKWIDYGCIGVRKVTDLGVAFMVDDWEPHSVDAYCGLSFN